MRIFTKVNGVVRVWEATDMAIQEAISAVKQELGPTHKIPVLALVKY